MDPECTGETIRIPRCEERRSNADEVGEYRDADGENKGGAVGEDDEEGPPEPARHGVGVQMGRVAEEADEDDFGGRVVVESARNCFCVSRDTVMIRLVGAGSKYVAFSACDPYR